MHVRALGAGALRLFAVTAVIALAVGCAAREAARRAEAAPTTRAAPMRPSLPAALMRLRSEFVASAGSRSIELFGEPRGESVLLRAIVPASALFRADTAILLDSGAALLREWGAAVALDPRLVVEIEGHTDELGRVAYNLEFSQQRADAVRAALIGAGVSAQQLTARGIGEARPLVAERTIAARERNRRIEIRVIAR